MEKRHAFLTPVKNLLYALILLPALGHALPPEYNASYDVKKFGMVIAKSDYSLKHENDGIRVTQHTETKGLAALLRNDVLDESSFISSQHGQLLMTEFSYQHQSADKKNRNIQLKIDWIESGKKLQGKVSGSAHGEKLELKVDSPVWDTSSFQIPLMLNTKEKTTPQQYTMMIKGKFKNYSFITHGIEEIEVNGNTIQAIKTERDGGTKKNPVYLWLAPSLNNLPVKIEKWKKGKLQLTLSLNHAQFPADNSMEFKAAPDEPEEPDEL
ncbi:MAG: DUF3108 domain-containing protein [Gammaproteobacteria bacterium]|nr:DUF3108 domain-containing protein [Gammaproteobacteria bacterium]